MNTKSETLTAIMRLNPTAKEEFLSRFSDLELDHYLRRLTELPTDRYGRWTSKYVPLELLPDCELPLSPRAN